VPVRLCPGRPPTESFASVGTGEADCCLATRAAARVFGLDFVPRASERYDLVIWKQHPSRSSTYSCCAIP